MTRAYPNHPIPAATAQRAAETYHEAGGCWISTLARNSGNYATVTWRVDGKAFSGLAHRAAWTHHNGPIPDGMTIDHLCKSRMCVNPTHMRLLTLAENGQQGGDVVPLGQCKWGHPNSMQRRVVKSGTPRSLCGPCADERNARESQWRSALRRLEKVYGLGQFEACGKSDPVGPRSWSPYAIRNARKVDASLVLARQDVETDA